jgi:hypothetical protein
VKPSEAAQLFKQHSDLNELVLLNPEWSDAHEHVELEMYHPDLEFKHFNTTIAVVKRWDTGDKWIDYVSAINLRIKRTGTL